MEKLPLLGLLQPFERLQTDGLVFVERCKTNDGKRREKEKQNKRKNTTLTYTFQAVLCDRYSYFRHLDFSQHMAKVEEGICDQQSLRSACTNETYAIHRVNRDASHDVDGMT